LHTLHLKDPSQITVWALLRNIAWKKDLELRQASLCGRSFQCVLKKKIRIIKTGGRWEKRVPYIGTISKIVFYFLRPSTHL
jgi:hypothetical protein